MYVYYIGTFCKTYCFSIQFQKNLKYKKFTKYFGMTCVKSRCYIKERIVLVKLNWYEVELKP